MATFPEVEAKIVSLAGSMIAGYTEHAADFPSALPAALTTAYGAYTAAKNAQTEAIGLPKRKTSHSTLLKF